MKVKEREEARRLRREEGMSMKAIARELGVSVGSVSLWTRDIELTEEQIDLLTSRNGRFGAQARGHRQRSENARIKRLRAQMEGRMMARRGDPLHRAGCMLYWGEGSKARNLGLPRSSLRNATVNNPSSASKRMKRSLPHGT